MSAFQDLLVLVEEITPENRQALIICLVNQTGPVRRTLSSDFGAEGLINKVNEALDRIVNLELRERRSAELLKWLSEEHCLWMLRPRPVQAA